MDEYTASLQDVRHTYVYDNPVAAYDLDVRGQRERAFDRLIRGVQDDVLLTLGYLQRVWETEEF